MVWVGGRCREPPPHRYNLPLLSLSLPYWGLWQPDQRTTRAGGCRSEPLKALWLRCWPRVRDPLLSGLF